MIGALDTSAFGAIHDVQLDRCTRLKHDAPFTSYTIIIM